VESYLPAVGARGDHRPASHRHSGAGVLIRLGVSAVGCAALAAAAIGAARVISDRWPVASGSRGPADPDELLVLGAAGATLLVAGWLVLGTVAAVVAHLPGRIGMLAEWVADHWAPALSRRVAAALVGAATMSSLAPAAGIAAPTPPAAAAQTATGPGFTSTSLVTPGPVTSGEQGALDQSGPPGWVPSRPVVAPPASPRLVTSTPTTTQSDRGVVVHRGDSLWDIARRHLGPLASDAQVAQAWPRWYAANREVIGADPGRLLPGQLLVIPTAQSPSGPGADRQAQR
jgi:LysM domain